jgi:Ca2+-binding RTX toxin-like protein
MTTTQRHKPGIAEPETKLPAGQTALAAWANDPTDKVAPLPKPPLFTPYNDVVDFNDLSPGQYDPASYYSALRGSDLVHLPADQATANLLGYDALKIFYGDLGNDYIVGGALNDLISGDQGNDTLFGAGGDDGLAGGSGNDLLFGGEGNDVVIAGIGLDYIEGGAGDDLIVAQDADQGFMAPGTFANAPVQGGKIYRDYILAGDGDDTIFATNSDGVDAGAGNDKITLNVDSGPGWAYGGDGSDTITGSTGDDVIATGFGLLWWTMNLWNEGNEALHGGFTDVVKSGDGNDIVLTMLYCNTKIDTGNGHDEVFVHGLLDVVSTGEGSDELYLNGGATHANLGAGDDYLSLTRAAYDNPNHSKITLGAGEDHIHVNSDEWFTNGDKQPMDASPLILDFTLGEDTIDHIWATNLDDATQSLDADNIHCVDIQGGSALVYDDPIDNTRDFVFARFNGVTAQDLQNHIDLNTAIL